MPIDKHMISSQDIEQTNKVNYSKVISSKQSAAFDSNNATENTHIVVDSRVIEKDPAETKHIDI